MLFHLESYLIPSAVLSPAHVTSKCLHLATNDQTISFALLYVSGPDSPSVPRWSSASRPDTHQPAGHQRQEDSGQQQEEVQGRVWRG